MRTLPRPRSAATLCAAALVLVLGACGQKGPLYHPEPAAAPAPAADAAAEDARKKDEKKPDGAGR